jgi:triphosphoribosyl-dephospho-CoA synthase
MGVEPKWDVTGNAPADLLEAMRSAQHRDRVARQYATGFQDVFERVVPWLEAGRTAGWALTTTIVHTHVRLLAEYPDSLITRKCGDSVALQAQARAERAITAGQPGDEAYELAVGDLDFWLRCDGHRRNPGTTADLITAGLFVGLREQTLLPPWR